MSEKKETSGALCGEQTAGKYDALDRQALVRLLAVTTDALVRPLGRHKADEPPVTEEEIKGGLASTGGTALVSDDGWTWRAGPCCHCAESATA